MHFVFDGDNLLLELDTNGNPKREYTYLAGADVPHSVKQADGSVLYCALDDPGNVGG